MRSGFVSLIGRPNVGKSSLLNAIVEHKVAITSNKAQTTRNLIQAVYNDSDSQIVFVDTPGIHKPKEKLGKVLNKQSYASMYDVDAILFVIDASGGLGEGDRRIIEDLKTKKTPIILVMNKIDRISNEHLLMMINEYKELLNFAEIVPVSAKKFDNIERLIEVIKKYLTDNVKYYDDDTITSCSKYFMISELVREKLLNMTIEEVPHSLTCLTTKYEDKGNIIHINVDIVVDRDSIKKIVIGKQGERLKKVGTMAREEIEEMLGKQVYLELYVKTIKNWRDKDRYINEFGFNETE